MEHYSYMKNFSFLGIVAAIVFLTVSAQAQALFTQSYTNVAASTTTNNATPSARVELHKGRPLTIVAHAGHAATNFGTFSLGFDVSLDGSLWTTLPVATSATFTGNPATTNFVGYALLSTNVTDHFRFIRHSQTISGSNAMTLQKIQYRFDAP